MYISFFTLVREEYSLTQFKKLQFSINAEPWFKVVAQILLALIVPLLILGLWIVSVRNHWVAPQILPAPEKVFGKLSELIANGDISRNLNISFWRVIDGLLVGGGIGFLLGVGMGLSKTVEAYVNPLFKAFASVPGLAWVPLAIMLVGIDEPLKVVLIAVACTVPVAVNTLAGFRNVPVNFIEVGKVYRFNAWQMLSKVVLPAALPPVFAGFSLALNQAWQTLIAVELLASSEGIGFMMTWGRQLMQMDVVLATIIVIGLVGLFLDKSLRLAEAYLMPWRPNAV